MTPTLSVALLALGLFVQASPPTGAAGSAGAAGSGGVKAGDATSGATMTKQGKKRGHDLADILLPLAGSAHRSGSFGPPSPPGETNVQVSSPNPAPQFSPIIEVDPTDRRHLIGAAIDRRHATTRSVFYASFDGGATWSEAFDSNESDESNAAFGGAGEIYCCSIRRHFPGGGDLMVGRSFDGGVTLSNWIKVTSFGSTGGIDQPVLAVDRTSGAYAGSVYLAYASGAEGLSGVGCVVSKDGGATWGGAGINDGPNTDGYGNTALAVGPDGVVHVIYYDFTTGILYSDASTDGGTTWGTDVVVANVGNFDIPNGPQNVFPTPVLAADTSDGPFRGNLYVVWAQSGGSSGPDVVLSTSTDGGATWSSPIPASDVTSNSQFTPALDVEENGNLNVGFYDCRNDPNNTRVDFYVSRSSDGGATFQPNVKVSDVDFDPSSYGTGGRIVDRAGVAASDREVHAIWTDGRNGDDDIFTAPANLSLFTDVASISAATGGTASFTVDPGPLFQSAEYHVLGSLSGTAPGTDFYFENVPINYDLFTLATIYEANGPIFPGFTGNLDATGAATAQLVSGPLPPALIGVQMDFAALVRVANGVRWGSAPTRVEIGN
jgi:hypothetical protein